MTRWVLQGRSANGSLNKWLDLFEARCIKALPKVNQSIARQLGAEYRVILKDKS